MRGVCGRGISICNVLGGTESTVGLGVWGLMIIRQRDRFASLWLRVVESDRWIGIEEGSVRIKRAPRLARRVR